MRRIAALLVLAQAWSGPAMAQAVAPLAPAGQQPPPQDIVDSDNGDGPGVVVRIVRDDPDKDLVRWLALNAKWTELTKEGYAGLEDQSAESIAQTLCGNYVPPSYWNVFREVNDLKAFAPKAAVGQAGYGYKWPACFWIDRGAFSDIVRPDNLASHIYLRETGSPGQPATHANFFAGSGYPDLGKVPDGAVLHYRFRTRPVVVVPRAGTKAKFLDDLDRKARQVAKKAENALQTRDEDPYIRDGEIVTARQDPSRPDRTPPDCISPDGKLKLGAPFDLLRVANAFNYQSSLVRDDIRLMVADNGFFGATRLDGVVTPADLFDRGFLGIIKDEASGRETIGPPLALSPGVNISPFNRENLGDAAVPDSDSGHGTHVVALAMGGPARTDGRFFAQAPGANAWLRVNVVAFSRGQRVIPEFPLSQFGDVLRRVNNQNPLIVNMSLKFGQSAQEPLDAVLKANPGTLFVAAAGNDNRDLDEKTADSYPAGLGGAANLIVVAADDGQGALTWFSNSGASTVDITAPGCNIASTLDGKVDKALLSGTSQAAPTVSFAAALLARRQLRVDRIKPRLMISGDILKGVLAPAADGHLEVVPVTSATPAPIRSQSQVNIARALFFNFDYLRYEDETGATVEVLGTLETRSGPTCGGKSRDFQKVVAFKRSGKGGQAWCFWRNELEPAPVATTASQTLEFNVVARLDQSGKPIPEDSWVDPTPLDRVEEFVLSEGRIAKIN